MYHLKGKHAHDFNDNTFILNSDIILFGDLTNHCKKKNCKKIIFKGPKWSIISRRFQREFPIDISQGLIILGISLFYQKRIPCLRALLYKENYKIHITHNLKRNSIITFLEYLAFIMCIVN